jgi:predicted metal-dependent phosphoesterase TrpH
MSIDTDLHIHTKYSFDSLLEPKTIIKLALKRGLSTISITDHDTIKGSLLVRREALPNKNLIVIPGIEVRTDRGDVIGLYVQDAIKVAGFLDVVDEIRRQDGLVVLPHPYNGREGVEKLANLVDVVEVLNGRCSFIENSKAFRLADEIDKPPIACSDAHFSFEIGRVKTRFYAEPSDPEELRKLILNGKREFIGRESPFIVHGLSFTVEVIKRLYNPQ